MRDIGTEIGSSQGRNMALTVSSVASLHDSGKWMKNFGVMPF
jgi:hypothetical protein